MTECKVCITCKERLPLSEFYKRASSRDGLKGSCKKCDRKYHQEWVEANRDRVREINRRSDRKRGPVKQKAYMIQWRYGISYEQYLQMFDDQSGLCAVCGRPPTSPTRPWLGIDHNHKCCPAKVEGRANRLCGLCTRGLLCEACNLGIGKFQDDPERLERAAAYLRQYQELPDRVEANGTPE